ncbi:rhamnulokinase [Saccharibacillus alkalitolerans]|uniref:Rhamnulokinase n=1 Tax=Saccharibacillus alkalitolerans TaxID=2705290 RepID=A0ABX0F6G3_9BACL|nr:rhamnulokinase [Saccharibacillus alkalitolerans]NGZ74756.1 rhamnulokinase [Saccharibacillus alkalitolerans]
MGHAIAVDIGASSGRLVEGTLIEGRLEMTEIYRFDNAFTEKDGHDYWDIDRLTEEILVGLRKAKAAGIDSCTLGIDTWGVDYVLLDRFGQRLHEVYAYRDVRTAGAADRFHRNSLDRSALYAKTGIQELSFNTLYQLHVHDRRQLEQADRILLVPDYFYYRLTGKFINEETNASTTQLLNLRTRDFDAELLGALGLKRDQFAALTAPGTRLGGLRPEFADTGDYPNCSVIAVPTHDTASAVAGVPAAAERSWAYLSSGTWSLLGAELDKPLTGEAARRANYTNEWGAYGTFRFLKNIMGLWMIQEVRREDGARHSFAELAEAAGREEAFRSLVPCNAERFLNPKSMTEEIRAFCRESGQALPDTSGRLARCVFDSLALTYLDAMRELERLTESAYEVLHIVGGGANNRLLSQLTSDLLGIEVRTGPSEATAIGNIAVQMISSGELADLNAARRMIAESFPPQTYRPNPAAARPEILDRWRHIHSIPLKETLR